MTEQKEKLYFNVRVKHNPFHQYHYKETIRAASYNGVRRTKAYKQYMKDLDKGIYCNIEISRV